MWRVGRVRACTALVAETRCVGIEWVLGRGFPKAVVRLQQLRRCEAFTMSTTPGHGEETEPLLPNDAERRIVTPPPVWRAIYASHFLRSWSERAW